MVDERRPAKPGLDGCGERLGRKKKETRQRGHAAVLWRSGRRACAPRHAATQGARAGGGHSGAAVGTALAAAGVARRRVSHTPCAPPALLRIPRGTSALRVRSLVSAVSPGHSRRIRVPVLLPDVAVSRTAVFPPADQPRAASYLSLQHSPAESLPARPPSSVISLLLHAASRGRPD